MQRLLNTTATLFLLLCLLSQGLWLALPAQTELPSATDVASATLLQNAAAESAPLPDGHVHAQHADLDEDAQKNKNPYSELDADLGGAPFLSLRQTMLHASTHLIPSYEQPSSGPYRPPQA